MEIKVLFNSFGITDDLSVGWGLSFLIDNRIVFDTGEKGDLLMNNIDKLNVDLSLIEAIVVSHDHWDHIGGLEELLMQKSNLKVYACPGFGRDFKNKISDRSTQLIEADDFTIVTTGIYSTGEIIGIYKGSNLSEQALILKTEKGFSVITGCAHPGIIKILERVQAQLSIEKFHAVLGGFHLKDCSVMEIKKIVKKFLKFKVRRVGVTHCSGPEAEDIFYNVYKKNFLSMNVGEVITI